MRAEREGAGNEDFVAAAIAILVVAELVDDEPVKPLLEQTVFDGTASATSGAATVGFMGQLSMVGGLALL